MKVTVVTPNRLQSKLLLANLLSSGIDVTLFVSIEKEKTHKSTLRASLKLLFKAFWPSSHPLSKINRIKSKNEKHANRMLRAYAKQSGLKNVNVSQLSTLEAFNINSEEVIDAIQKSKVDYVFIWGVPIVKKNFINAPIKGVLNAHTSMLPEYRGARAEFWQFYNQDFAHAGISIHRVDQNVDTGDILYQKKALEIDLANPEMLRVKNSIRIIEALPEILKGLELGLITPIRQNELPKPQTPTYRFRDVGLAELKRVYLS